MAIVEESKSTGPNRIFVSSCLIRHQSVELPSGHLVAVEARTPAQAFAVVLQQADEVLIVQLCAQEGEAIEAAKKFVLELEGHEAEGAKRRGEVH